MPDWLAWQRSLSTAGIDLTLDRCHQLRNRMALDRLPMPVIVVGGTNGKGACVSMLDAALRSAGYRVGKYQSPPLEHFRESVQINGQWASEAQFIRSFAEVGGEGILAEKGIARDDAVDLDSGCGFDFDL